MSILTDMLNKTLQGVVNVGTRRASKKQAPVLYEGTFDKLKKAPAACYTAGFGNAPVLPDDIDTVLDNVIDRGVWFLQILSASIVTGDFLHIVLLI